MNKNDNMNAVRFLSTYREVFRDMYARCLAITGTESAAQSAVMDAMLSLGPCPGRSASLGAANNAALKYDCAPRSGYSYLDEGPLSNESEDTRLCAVLLCGCGLNIRQTAGIMDMKPAGVKAELEKALCCLKGSSRSHRLKALSALCCGELRAQFYKPDMSAFSSVLESRMEREKDSSEIGSGRRRIFSSAVAFITLLIIGFLLWSGAVLLNYLRESANLQITVAEETNVSVQGTD